MRVLLVRLSAMGDVVHALGAIEALALARPELELCVVTQRAYTPLLEGMPLATVIAHDRRPPLRGLLAVARRVRALRADVAVDLQGNWKSALIARASAARLRIGARAAERREPASAVLLNRRIACGAPHPASQAFALLRQLAPDLAPRLPRLRARADAVDAEARALAAAGIGAARPFRVLVLTDPRDPRSWPAAALEREARASPLPALVLAGPAEARLPWTGSLPCLRHGAGELHRLIALGALVARAGGEALGPDQGATHVLAASGARTTVLFGPQDPQRTAPPATRALVAAQAPPCMPCRARRCRHPQGPVCMDFTLADGRAVAGWPGAPPAR